ncbi:MAG: hypothetical protein GY832_29640 [Chloroflexi bacterium]|nr:hypothetical protein [Chloroflexota bacterium]
MNNINDDHDLSDDVKAVRHFAETDPVALNHHLELLFRQQYQVALEALCDEMGNRDREQKVVLEKLSKLQGSGRPAPEHIPTLIALERITREAGGTEYCEVEKTIFQVMAFLSHLDLITFLVEAFQYRRRHDSFAERRREYSIDIVAVIAAHTSAPQAITALGEMLADPAPKIRGVALDIIYEAYEREAREMPGPLLDYFWQLGRDDPDRRVRQTALAFLQRMGQVSYAEALRYLEGR